MSDQTTTVPPELLDIDLATIDTSFPVIRGGMYDLIVKDSNVVRTNANDGDMWEIKLGVTQPATGVKGETIKDVTLFHRVGLNTTEKYSPEQIAKNAARVIQAVKPTVLGVKVQDLFNEEFKVKCKMFNGRMVQAKVEALPEGVDKRSGRTLPPRNEISQFVKAS